MEVIKLVAGIFGSILLLLAIAFIYAVSKYRKEDCWDNGEDDDNEDALLGYGKHPEHSNFVVNQKGVLEEIEPDTCPLCLQSHNENLDAMCKDIDPRHLCRCKDCGRVYDVLPDDF